MLEILSRPTIWAPLVFIVGYVIYKLFLKPSGLPDLPVIGKKSGDWFPLFQAGWRNTLDIKAAFNHSYAEYKEQAVILPLADAGNMVLLPASLTQFVTDQPESVLSMHASAQQSLQTDYTCVDPSLVQHPIHHHLITTTLTNQIGNLVPDIADETAYQFDKLWGDSTEYKEVCVYDTLRQVVGGVTNRVFVGLPACRDPALLAMGMAYAQDVPLSATVLRMVPAWLRPLAAPIITLPGRFHTWQFHSTVFPTIKRRLEEHAARESDPEKKLPDRVPNDFLEWSIKQAKETGDPKNLQPSTLATRILLLNFAAIHTTSFGITHAILDLVASKPEYIAELRHDISSALAECDGEWNKRALAKMEKLDSVLRESMRLNSLVTVGLNRMVVAKDGLTTPSGLNIPQGSAVCVPGYSVFHDDSVYPDAKSFKPFRFSEIRGDETLEYVKRARNSTATTSTQFLAFGHGRNACPGRFFATNELKLILAHLVLNYDIEMQPQRPGNVWFGLNRMPPMQASIRIRKRKATS